eukprot:1177510-Prorocentrum_minimum.AAC.4
MIFRPRVPKTQEELTRPPSSGGKQRRVVSAPLNRFSERVCGYVPPRANEDLTNQGCSARVHSCSSHVLAGALPYTLQVVASMVVGSG